jgi:hypothetical protein
LKTDTTWINSAQGKAVKIVAPLLPGLPAKQRYKVVFMRRSLTEILVSQQVMLGKSKTEALRNFPLRLANNLQLQEDRAMQWMQQQPHVEFIELNYEQLMKRDKGVEDELSSLFEEKEFSSIWEAVDDQLYRNKLTN